MKRNLITSWLVAAVKRQEWLDIETHRKVRAIHQELKDEFLALTNANVDHEYDVYVRISPEDLDWSARVVPEMKVTIDVIFPETRHAEFSLTFDASNWSVGVKSEDGESYEIIPQPFEQFKESLGGFIHRKSTSMYESSHDEWMRSIYGPTGRPAAA